MKINQIIVLVLVALSMSGCGDQVWCGENGCSGKDMTSAPSTPVQI